METNKINWEDKELIWEYEICPCLECPIYPLQKEWEDDPDIRNNKCWTSRCTWNKMKAKEIADELQFWKENYHCVDCDQWFPKENFDEPYCPECGMDFY